MSRAAPLHVMFFVVRVGRAPARPRVLVMARVVVSDG